jgi:hypothetical protein
VRANSQGESEPSPLLYQQALRDVIGRCLYGVDINPMSAELCRVSLWLEALEPGKPLSFLDHHIQLGNSLLGTTPALLAQGIPDDAFKPIEGDVKSRCTELKRDNKRERQEYQQGQGYLFDPPYKLGNLAAEFAKIDAAGDDTPEAVHEKERRYAELVKGQSYQFGRLLADPGVLRSSGRKTIPTSVGSVRPNAISAKSNHTPPPACCHTCAKRYSDWLASINFFTGTWRFQMCFRSRGEGLLKQGVVIHLLPRYLPIP